jgi:multidrug efflux pump subunit AcrB
MPLDQAAFVERGRSYTQIKRRDGRRVVNVTADVDEALSNAAKVLADAERDKLPPVLAAYDGLSYSLEGEQRQQRETMQSLGQGFVMALIAIFGLLAVAFRSYVQPLIIMLVIPFGLVGAVVGHVVMGYDLSLMSMMGIVALAGVVVNDSLILIVATNDYRSTGMGLHQAILEGGARRFRPIILTSLTTFFGLMPMILETSMQARFLIPMAISLGFGVLFATLITLVMVPAIYAAIDDGKRGIARTFAWVRGAPSRAAASPGE